MVWGHQLEHGVPNVVTYSKRLILSPPPRNYQQPVVSQQGWGLEIISTTYAGILTGLILCRSYAGSYNCCEFLTVAATSCSEANLSNHAFPFYGTYILPPPL